MPPYPATIEWLIALPSLPLPQTNLHLELFITRCPSLTYYIGNFIVFLWFLAKRENMIFKTIAWANPVTAPLNSLPGLWPVWQLLDLVCGTPCLTGSGIWLSVAPVCLGSLRPCSELLCACLIKSVFQILKAQVALFVWLVWLVPCLLVCLPS